LVAIGSGPKYTLKVTTSIVILRDVYVRSRDILGRMQVVVELTKQVEDQDRREAILELISANVFSSYGVVLTDLERVLAFSMVGHSTRGSAARLCWGLIATLKCWRTICMEEEVKKSLFSFLKLPHKK